MASKPIAQPTQPLRFLRLPEVQRLTGKSRSSIYRDVSLGRFPRPIRVGENISAWLENEIAEYQLACIQASRGAA